MKTLTLELIGNETAKVDDTNTVFRFKAYWNGGIVRFTDKDEISFKIGQNNQLVKQAPGYPEKDITQLNASDLTGLKPGTYQLEMWVTRDGKTNIWPTHGFYSFALEQNLMSGDVSEGVSTITLADFERRFSDLSDKQQTQFSELKDQLTDYVGTLQGPQGEPGLSPHINGKGNWQVGDEDTGVKAKGETGDRGPEGPRGKIGERGETGDQGPQGDPGPQGEPGQRGSSIYYSKYEGEPNERGRIWSGLTPTPSDANPPRVGETLITPSGRVYKITAVNATDKTYAIGDEEAIIQGPIGPQGLRGPEGVQGPPGEQGKAFTITKSFPSVAEMTGDDLSNGDFVIIASPDEDNGKFYRYNGSDFELVGNLSGAQGIQGPRGDPGPQGAPGEAGITPHIGQNGNWILGDTDTNVRASFNSSMLSEYATKTYVNDKTDVKVIHEPIDFNDFTTVGKYYIRTTRQTNGPLTEDQWGYLIVSEAQGRSLQFFIIDSQNNQLRKICWRIYVDADWSQWFKVANVSDIPSLDGYAKTADLPAWNKENNSGGGVNLLKNSATFEGWTTHSPDTLIKWSAEGWLDPNDNRTMVLKKTAWNGLYYPLWLNEGYYTFSGYYYLEGETGNIDCFIVPNGGDNRCGITGASTTLSQEKDKWIYFQHTFKVTKAGNAATRLETSGNGGIFHIGSLKLERGTVATPWTPNPADMASTTYVDDKMSDIPDLTPYLTKAEAEEKYQPKTEAYVWKPYVADDGMWHLRKEAIE